MSSPESMIVNFLKYENGSSVSNIDSKFYFTPTHLILMAGNTPIPITIKSREGRFIRNLASFVSSRKHDKIPKSVEALLCHPECQRRYVFAKFMPAIRKPKTPKCKHVKSKRLLKRIDKRWTSCSM